MGALKLGGGSIWPEKFPTISGAVVCYDATQEKSLSGVKEVLGEQAARRD